MNNFQLYRTNLALGGQMKWDLIIDSAATKLYVADFHLTPISPNIPYTYKSEENLLKNKHQDNVKEYYKKIEGYFYNSGLNAEYSHNWPLICKENEHLDAYSNIYDMGCKRSKKFNIYKKQFEFFCPVWIEHLTGDLEFKIEIRPLNSNKTLAVNTLRLSKNNIKSHSKFVDYFNAYASDAGLKNGNDDIFNVKFSNYLCSASGLNASDGTFITKYIDSFVNNITMRERPLMEVDNMIIDAFRSNTLISRQLFNFNLCFNAEDILSGAITKMLFGQQIHISVDVYMNGMPLEKRDFYTDYEFINKEINSTLDRNISVNVLDYLCDYKSLDLIDKNKFCQEICHWSLCDNNNYIFNVYGGFSGITAIEHDETGELIIRENDHQYGCTPNTMINKYDASQNSAGWINTINVNRWNDFYKYIKSTDTYKKNAVYIGDSTYINNIKYNLIPTVDEKGFYMIGMLCNYNIFASIIDSFQNACRLNTNAIISNLNHNDTDIPLLNAAKELCWLIEDDLLMVISSNVDLLAFNTMQSILYLVNKYDYIGISNECLPYLKAMHTLINSKADTELIMFGGGLLWGSADGPTTDIQESIFYKDNNTQEYILRYDGKIKPTFINDSKNTLYYKDYISDDRTKGKSKLQNSTYVKYINTGYEPLYPSIGYCSIKKISNWNYVDVPYIKVSEHTNNVSIYKDIEYSWFNNSTAVILDSTINFSCINKIKPDGSYDSLQDIIHKYIKETYNINDDNIVKYIVSKYEYKNNWEYVSDDNINDYTYNIKMKLK